MQSQSVPDSSLTKGDTMMRRTMLVGFMVLVMLTGSRPALGEEPGDPCRANLPEQVQAMLREGYGQWRIETKADLSDDHQRMWDKTHGLECPGLASGHFRSADSLSFAILLISKNPKVVGYRVLVADSDSQNRYHAKLLERYDQPIPSDVVIYRVAPGKYFQPEGSGDISIDLDGIVFESMESGAFLYHWKDARYKRALISE